MIPLWQHLPTSQQQNLNTFQLFARCHNTYTAAKAISEPEIRQFCKHTICAVCPIKYTEKQICYDLRLLVCIGTDVWEFLEYYHNNFPLATIMPKMHMLEDHATPWMERWHFCPGLHGKQGPWRRIPSHF